MYQDIGERSRALRPSLFFYLSRLLDLRSTPFVTGRRLNWFKDILPVANDLLIDAANITQGNVFDVILDH